MFGYSGSLNIISWVKVFLMLCHESCQVFSRCAWICDHFIHTLSLETYYNICLNNLEGKVSIRMLLNEVHMIVVDLFLMYRGYVGKMK